MDGEKTGPAIDPSIRLVPLSDIDAFVECRSSAILDEAAILCVQFLGGGDENKSRSAFIQLAVERFDKVNEEYQLRKMVTAVKHRAERVRQEKARAAAQAEETPPASDTGEPEKKPEE